MKRIAFAAALLALTPAVAQAAEPAIIVSAADLQKLIAAAKAAPSRPVVLEPVIKLAPYTVNLEYRVGKAPATLRAGEAELIFVIDGSATLTTGGTLVGGGAPSNGNIDGAGIAGGADMHFAKGDVTIIPENTPHMLLPDGAGPLVLMTLYVPRSAAPAPAAGRGAAPRLFTSAAEVQAMIGRGKDSLPDAVKAGRMFSGETLLSLPPYRIGLEYRSAKGTPSVHKTDAELMWVLDGSGTMNTDGALVNSHDTNPANSEGDSITGGKANHLAKGDFIMIPQNGPHQSFTDGQFVLATMHLPRPDAPAK